MVDPVFKEAGAKTALLQKELEVSRTTAHRILTGERFKSVKNLFLKIYAVTNLTPNDILGIPPKSGKES